ncbi:MAG: hypothetical protein QMD97_00730 [Candidatus Aenigmarchaeota archaeon]|nr:hypothetical protein [Candidatus Aenigmarchaeota archaeon]
MSVPYISISLDLDMKTNEITYIDVAIPDGSQLPFKLEKYLVLFRSAANSVWIRTEEMVYDFQKAHDTAEIRPSLDDEDEKPRRYLVYQSIE